MMPESRPKDGVYLDAALAVIGEQVAERIDERERRRRRRRGFVSVALAVAVVGSGSFAAAALVSRGDTEVTAPAAYAEAAEVRCVEGSDAAQPGYFTVRFRAPESTEVDRVLLCRGAWHTVAADADALAAMSPVEAATHAGMLVAEAAGLSPEEILVDEAAFAPVSTAKVAPMTVCAGDNGAVVLSGAASADPTAKTHLCQGVAP